MKTIIHILAAVCSLTLAAAHADWGPDTNLTPWTFGGSWTTSNNARGMACSGDTVYLVWQDYRWSPRNYGCWMYFKFFDGSAWSLDTTIGAFNTSRFHNWNASCAVDGAGRLHVVWESNDINYPDQGNYDIVYRCRQNNAWSAAVRLTTHPLYSWYPDIAIGTGGRLDVFWQDSREGTFKIYSRYFDGSAWQAEYCLDTLCRAAGYPSAASVQGRASVAWQDSRTGLNQIFFMAQGPGGWGIDSAVSHSTSGAFTPCLVPDAAGDLHLAWEDYRDGNGEIYYRRLPHSTGIWGPEERLTQDPAHSRMPVMVCRGDTLVDLFWADDRDGNYEIYTAQSKRGAWGPERRLTWNAAFSLCPSAAADSRGNLHLAWTDQRGNPGYSPDVYFMSDISDPWPKSGRPAQRPANPISRFAARPNPSSGPVTFEFQLAEAPAGGSAELGIYNLSGQRITGRRLFPLASGWNRFVWDGLAEGGRAAAAGVYLARLSAGGWSASSRMVLLR